MNGIFINTKFHFLVAFVLRVLWSNNGNYMFNIFLYGGLVGDLREKMVNSRSILYVTKVKGGYRIWTMDVYIQDDWYN